MSSNMKGMTNTTTSQSEALLKEADVERNIVFELTSDDVLLGRGVGPNEHIGNVRYRNIVKAHQPEYLATINRSIKDMIAHKAIASVKSNGGRFLRRIGKDKAKSFGCDRDVFVVAETKAVLEKTKQALRFQGRNKGEATTKATEPPKKNEAAMTCEGGEQKKQKVNVEIPGKVLPPTKVKASEHTQEEMSGPLVKGTRCSLSFSEASSLPRNDHRLFSSASSRTSSQSLPRGLPGISPTNPANHFLQQVQLIERLRRQRVDTHRVHARMPQVPLLELLQIQHEARNSTIGLSTTTIQRGLSRHGAPQQLRQGTDIGALNGLFQIDRCLLPGGLRQDLVVGSPSINARMSNALLDQLLSSQRNNSLQRSRIVTAELLSMRSGKEKQQGSTTSTGQSRQNI